jgi:hypothetical protein
MRWPRRNLEVMGVRLKWHDFAEDLTPESSIFS